ncbi:hypothetical protein BG005_003336, partial [Podila minutissima]
MISNKHLDMKTCEVYRSLMAKDFKYIPLTKLGEGTFGQVMFAGGRHEEERALKFIHYEDAEDKSRRIDSEVEIHQELSKHPHIVTYVETLHDEGAKVEAIVMHKMHQSLDQYMRKIFREGKVMQEELVWRISGQIAETLAYMHQQPGTILHRDLKPDNILLTDDLEVRLSDFGLARRIDDPKNRHRGLSCEVGTYFYMSPEVYNSDMYNEKSDVFSLGVCMYIMVSGRNPFYVEGEDEVKVWDEETKRCIENTRQVLKCKNKAPPKFMRCSESLKNLIMDMISPL